MEENENKKVNVVIRKYKALQDILQDRKSILRLSLLVLAISVALFGGISIILVSLKSLYPYNDITTNVMGATSIRNEDKEVSYWLFNTAQLWADSGIKVKAGETITVRASGKKHTAIHHLVKDTYTNEPKLHEPWTGGEGIIGERDERDSFRAQFKIYENVVQDALLMQVVPTGHEPEDRPGNMSKNQFVVIGKQAENIYIKENGTLRFAINDIVLEDETIFKMVQAIASRQTNALLLKLPDKDSLADLINDRKNITYGRFLSVFKTDSASILPTWNKHYSISSDDKIAKSLRFGSVANDTNTIELFGYFRAGNKTPWFEDNVGSFLIIVEKTQ